MKLLLDEHYGGLIAERLRGAGHDVLTVADLGLRGLADEPLLERARQDRRALLTNNVRHFAPLAVRWAAEGRSHSGLLFTDDHNLPRSAQTIGTYLRLLDALLAQYPAADALRARRTGWHTRNSTRCAASATRAGAQGSRRSSRAARCTLACTSFIRRYRQKGWARGAVNPCRR